MQWQTNGEMEKQFKRVIFCSDFEDELCPECSNFDYDCECPGPHSETSDGTPFLFDEVDGILYAKPPEGYGWDGEPLTKSKQ